MAKRRTKRTGMQQAALEAYLVNGHKIEKALLTAGYSPNTARNNPGEVWYVPAIQDELKRRLAKATKKVDLTVEWILKRLMARADAGAILAQFKKVDGEGDLFWDFTDATKDELALVSAIGVEYVKSGRGDDDAVDIKKVKVSEPDVGAALRDLMRHKGMFNDKLEITGSLEERIEAGRRRAYKKPEDQPTVH